MADSKDRDYSGLEPAHIEHTTLDRDVEASPTKPANNHDAVEPAAGRTDAASPRGLDKATVFLKQTDQQIVVTHGDSRRVVKLIDWHILPILLFIYCLQSLDKNTLSYASVFGLIKDTGLEGDQYSWLGSVVYVAQLVFQPLVAYILVKFPIGKFLAVMVFAWGAIICGMIAAHNFTGLLTARLFLGIFESAVGKLIFHLFQIPIFPLSSECGVLIGSPLCHLAPTFVAVVQMWYRRREQTKRNAAWYCMLGVVNMVRYFIPRSGPPNASEAVLAGC
jgi:hypothetical protein